MVREVPQVDASELVKEYILLGVWLAQAGWAWLPRLLKLLTETKIFPSIPSSKIH